MDKKLAMSLVALYTAYFLVYIHRTVTGVIQGELSNIATSNGIEPSLFISMVASAYFYAYAAMQLPSGVFSDALGAKRYVALSMFILGLGSLISSVPNPWLIVAGRVLVGIGASAVWISIQRVIGVYADKSLGATLTGIGLAVGNFGALFATLPIRILINISGLSGTLLFLSIVAFLVGIISFVSINDHGVSSRSIKEGFKQTLQQLRVVVRSPHSLALGMAYLGSYSAILSFQSLWAPIYIKKYYPQYIQDTPSLLFMLALAFLIGVSLMGFISDRVLKRRKPILQACCLLHAISWLVLAFLPILVNVSYNLLLLLFFILGLVASTHMVISPMAREAYNHEYSGTTFSFVNMIGFLGVAIYQSIATFNPDPLTVVAVFSILSIIALALSRNIKETLKTE